MLVRAGAADSGLRVSQRMLLRECDCAEKPGAPSSSCEGCEERQLQRSREGLRPSRIPARGRVHPRIASAIDASRGGGQPLERPARERLERRLGESLGDVRVHADAHAGALARAVSARAFAIGTDLFFADGEYRPGSRDGDKLIAHEATHVVQQRDAPVRGALTVSSPGDPLELEADAMARSYQDAALMHQRPDSAPSSWESSNQRQPEADRIGAGAPGAGLSGAPTLASIQRQADTPAAGPIDYMLGYDDGWAGNPETGGKSAVYYQGYHDGLAAANPPVLPSGQLSHAQLMGLWQDAGGGSPDIAAAIAEAESTGSPGAIQQKQTYANTGWGLWQITPGDSVPDVGVDFQLLNPFLNAQAAVRKWKQAGSFHPWTTYNNGIYQKNLQPGVSPDSSSVVDQEYEPYGKPSPIAPEGTHNSSAGE
ncbi:MAG: DUF4157 domain-containing protein [Streptosporangiaceae bacterium]